MVLAAIIGVLGYACGLVISALVDLPSGAVIVWSIAISAIAVTIVFRQTSSQAG
jgi:zinc/manganese transport system permease protein